MADHDDILQFEIVPGYLPTGEAVYRVVGWDLQGTRCLGGFGSFFKKVDAEAYIRSNGVFKNG